jgi:hypothetical protein
MQVQEPIEFVKKLIRQGRYSFSRDEAARELPQDVKKLSQSLKGLSDKGRWSWIAHGILPQTKYSRNDVATDEESSWIL